MALNWARRTSTENNACSANAICRISRLFSFFNLRAIEKQNEHQHSQQDELQPRTRSQIPAQPRTDKIYDPSSQNCESIGTDRNAAGEFSQACKQGKLHNEVEHDDRGDQFESERHAILKAPSSRHNCPPRPIACWLAHLLILAPGDCKYRRAIRGRAKVTKSP